jgi:dimethylargininase
MANMMKTPIYKYAIIRDVPDSFDSCIKPSGESIIDIELAKVQHKAYRKVLENQGIELLILDADNRFPDCCFVEDTTIVVGDKAIVLHMGAPSRVGEEMEVGKQMANHKQILELRSPAAIDGGDVLQIGSKLFVGLSQRTNHEAVSQLGDLLADDGCDVVAVPLEGVLHLKSACSYLGDGCVLVCRGYFDDNIFSAYKNIIVHPEDAYSANCLSINGKVIISKGFPRTKAGIAAAGFEISELDMSEFRKGGGSLTCLSILF